MSRVCQVTGKGPKTGTRFRMPTIASVAASCRICIVIVLAGIRKRWVSLRISTRGLRTIEKRAWTWWSRTCASRA